MPEAVPPARAADGGPPRRLAAILHADVVGYSRHMGRDELGTHARLIAARSTLEGRIVAHGGRVVGTAGDATLAEFASLSEALTAAIEAQEALAEAHAALPPEQRLHFRIGLNLGEVIVDGDDIFGDGVNVAARVEALAEPGGIAVSAAVVDQLRRHPGVVFEDLGTQRLKNVETPIRVYAVRPAGTAVAADGRRARSARRLTLAGIGVVLLAGLAAFALRAPIVQWWAGSGVPVTEQAPVVPARISGKPTVAVLPFEEAGAAESGYFADGITEDVISELGRFSSLLVLSWSAVAPYKDEAVAPDVLSRELDVRYVVSGTIRRAGDELRLSVQLTDAERGVLLWSERYEVTLDDVFAVQDAITRQVVGALAVNVGRLEQARVRERPTADLGAYDLVLRGRELLHRVEREANYRARVLFEEALASDPDYADAHVGLAESHLNDFKYGWTQWPATAVAEAERHAGRAIEAATDNARAHAVRAEVLRFQGDFAAAGRSAERAVQLNPNSAASHAIEGGILVYSGEAGAAIAALELALRLDPHPEASWLVNLAQAYYFVGRYDDVIALFDRFAGGFEEEPTQHLLQAAAHGQLGQEEAGRRELERLRRVSPFFDAQGFASNLADPAQRDRLLEGLRKAGWEG